MPTLLDRLLNESSECQLNFITFASSSQGKQKKLSLYIRMREIKSNTPVDSINMAEVPKVICFHVYIYPFWS